MNQNSPTWRHCILLYIVKIDLHICIYLINYSWIYEYYNILLYNTLNRIWGSYY